MTKATVQEKVFDTHTEKELVLGNDKIDKQQQQQIGQKILTSLHRRKHTDSK